MSQPKLGTILIATLHAIAGVLMVIGGIGIQSLDIQTYSQLSMFYGIGGILLWIVGLIMFALAYGLIIGHPIAWYVVVVLSGLSFISALTMLNVFGLIIPGLILWYLWNNKNDFGV